MSVPEITPDELASRIGGVVLVDVRQPDEYEAAHVRSAHLIPLDTLPDRIGEVPTDQEVFVMCRSGGRSAVASEFLVGHGISAVNLVGGILAWVEAGHEVVTGAQPE